MPLYGHELSTSTYPAQAGLGRVVAFSKEGEFVGREAAEEGPGPGARVLVGLTAEGKRAGRAGYGLYSADREVGEVTSGALSPTLGHPIAMAYVAPGDGEPGTMLDIEIREQRVSAEVVPLPFYRRPRQG